MATVILTLLETHCQKGQGTPDPVNEKKKISLPLFNAIDINGKQIKSSDFIGRNLFVQFINSETIDDIDLLEKVYLNWIDDNLAIIAIPMKLEHFRTRVGIELDEITVLSNEYDNLKMIFKAPTCCESFYLFDTSGNLIKSGFNRLGYEEEVKKYLTQMIKNKTFDISTFIMERENVKNVEWLNRCSKIVEQEDREYYIFSMFTSICSGCPSGRLIKRLTEIHSLSEDRIYVLSIVPENFTDIDIENFKNFLGIDFTVERADKKLNEIWENQISEYSESDLTNILFLIDRNGKIVRVTDNNPNHIKSFFSFIHSILSTERKGVK